jgi:hypothetical protein
MTSLAALWLPILLAAVFVFVVSSVIHMVLPFHRKDYGPLPGEAAVLDAMRKAGVPPGQFMFPGCANMKDMASPEMQAKYAQGPVGTMIVLPSGIPNLGKSLATWFLFCIVVGVFTAYLAGLAMPPGTAGRAVFRFTSAAAALGYAFSHVVDSIWKGLSWRITLKFVADGIAYALVTGAAFAWLWPAA